jgi:hypothetical protein
MVFAFSGAEQSEAERKREWGGERGASGGSSTSKNARRKAAARVGEEGRATPMHCGHVDIRSNTWSVKT